MLVFFFFQKDEEEEEKSNQIIKDSVIEDVFRTFLYECVCVCVLCTHNTRIYGEVWSPNIRSNVTQKTSFFRQLHFKAAHFGFGLLNAIFFEGVFLYIKLTLIIQPFD